MDSRTLLYIVLGGGILVILYMTLKDLLGKKEEPVKPAADVPQRSTTDKAILPMQLQAYERLVLLVERINLQNLISRTFQPGLTATDMQIGLIQTIKAEYEHNIAQQIYVSPIAWEAIKTLKEQTITIINQVASQLPPEATAMDLNKQILEIFLQAETSPSELTAQILNTEAKRLF